MVQTPRRILFSYRGWQTRVAPATLARIASYSVSPSFAGSSASSSATFQADCLILPSRVIGVYPFSFFFFYFYFFKEFTHRGDGRRQKPKRLTGLFWVIAFLNVFNRIFLFFFSFSFLIQRGVDHLSLDWQVTLLSAWTIRGSYTVTLLDNIESMQILRTS